MSEKKKEKNKKGCFISLTIFFIFIILGIIFIVSTFSKFTAGPKVDIGSNSWIEINIGEDLPYFTETSVLSGKRQFTYFDLYNSLEKIKNDDDVKGIILKNLNISGSKIEEIYDKIEEVKKSGKKVYAYLENFDRNKYVKTVIADKIYLNPSESNFISLTGYYHSQTFYKRMFDKIGIKYNVIHVGDYKGTGETFTRNSMSEYLKQNLKSIFDGLFENQIDRIVKHRGYDRNKFLKKILDGDYFLISPKKAKENKLVDDIIYREQFYNKYKIKNRNIVNIASYAGTVKNDIYKDKIAVIIADGPISMGKSKRSFNPLMGFQKSLGADTFTEQIKKAANREDVKGIVLRVDSPGGSALASDIMWNAIIEAKKKKPVYVSMGNMAASGGYYISAPADKIYANNNTILGSIGVVMMVPDLSDFMSNKLYLNTDSIKKGKYSDFGKRFTIPPEQRRIIRESMIRTYKEFKKHVSTGRDLPMDYVEKIAQGKIYIGENAKEIGLIDSIGSLEKAIDDMKNQLKLKKISLKFYPEEKTFFEKIKEGKLLKLSRENIDLIKILKEVSEKEMKPQYVLPFSYKLNN